MYICPICNKGFKTENSITTHSLQCWREHNPHHEAKPAPCKGNTTKREVSEEINNFFTSFRKEQYGSKA